MSSSLKIDHAFLVELESRGLVKSTFIRLDDERRGLVLDAVLAESARSGPESINIKEVARGAGVPVGSLYQYFGDRDSLARFAALALAKGLSEELLSALPYLEPLPLREALTAYLSYGIEWSVKEAASLRSFVAAAYRGAPVGSPFSAAGATAAAPGGGWYVESLIRPVAAAMQDVVRRVFAAAAARGELRGGLDVEAAARLANVLLIAVGDARMMPRLDEYYRIADPGETTEAVVSRTVDFICRSALREEAAP
jgi:AcrR family transcriptional regulator